MKINILDAALAGKGGHPFDFDRKLLRHFAQTGHETHLYTYRGASDAVVAELQGYGPVIKVLRSFHYGISQPVDHYAGEWDGFLRESEILAEDLRGVEDADVWIWPTFGAKELYACALRGADAPVIGCIHEDPGIEARSTGAMLWRAAFLAARRKGLRFTVGSVEPELRHRFSPIVPDRRFVTFPQPFDGPAPAAPKAALKRIGFFGHQRGEKGGRLMASLIERLTADGYAITLQNSNERYHGPDAPGLELLGFVEDIAVPMAECDLIVLPYAIESYRAKGSGILAQSLALGIPTIGPIGTLPGRTIEHWGIGPLFVAPTSDAIHAAIQLAARNYAVFAENAARAAHQFAKRNGAAQFAAALLAAAR